VSRFRAVPSPLFIVNLECQYVFILLIEKKIHFETAVDMDVLKKIVQIKNNQNLG
jgi:hypothetical protein